MCNNYRSSGNSHLICICCAPFINCNELKTNAGINVNNRILWGQRHYRPDSLEFFHINNAHEKVLFSIFLLEHKKMHHATILNDQYYSKQMSSIISMQLLTRDSYTTQHVGRPQITHTHNRQNPKTSTVEGGGGKFEETLKFPPGGLILQMPVFSAMGRILLMNPNGSEKSSQLGSKTGHSGGGTNSANPDIFSCTIIISRSYQKDCL